MAASFLFHILGTEFFFCLLLILLLLYLFIYIKYTLLQLLLFLLLNFLSIFILSDSNYTKYSLAVFQKQIPIPGSLVFWYLCTYILYTPQKSHFSTLLSILALLKLCFSEIFSICHNHNTPVLFFIRSILAFSLAISFVD